MTDEVPIPAGVEAPKWASLVEMLKRHHLRPTSQRVLILRYLAWENAHYRPEEIFLQLNQEYPASSRATVYNTLHCLVKAGLVHEALADNGGHYYALNRGPHYHFLCQDCGSIEDIPLGNVKAIEAPDLPDFQVDAIDITFKGTCRRDSCRNRKSGPAAGSS